MGEDDKKLLTGDRRISRAEADQLTGTRGWEITSVEQLKELAEAAKSTHDAFLDEAAEIMTPELAAKIRELRVDEGYSWRAVAQSIYDLTGGGWSPPSNQLMGMALCEHAAAHFGEHYRSEPWN